MISRSLTSSLERIHERWRDRILTGLTLLMSLDLFVVAPLGAAHAVHIRSFSIGIVILLAAGLVIVSRSVVPIVAIIAAVGILGASLVMQARGSQATLDLCLEATSWLLVGFVIIWVVARAVFAAGRVTYHRVIGAILLYLTIGFVFVALFTLVRCTLSRIVLGSAANRPGIAAKQPRLLQLHDADHRGLRRHRAGASVCSQPDQRRSNIWTALSRDIAGANGHAADQIRAVIQADATDQDRSAISLHGGQRLDEGAIAQANDAIARIVEVDHHP